MKLSAVVIIATAVAFIQNIELTRAEINAYDMLVSDCAAQEGATDAEIKAALAMELPTTKPGKCLNACIGEKTGIMKNNKLDVETTVEMTKLDFSDDPETIRIVAEISKECADVTDEDRCESAYKIIICTDNAAKSRGLVFNR